MCTHGQTRRREVERKKNAETFKILNSTLQECQTFFKKMRQWNSLNRAFSCKKNFPIDQKPHKPSAEWSLAEVVCWSQPGRLPTFWPAYRRHRRLELNKNTNITFTMLTDENSRRYMRDMLFTPSRLLLLNRRSLFRKFGAVWGIAMEHSQALTDTNHFFACCCFRSIDCLNWPLNTCTGRQLTASWSNCFHFLYFILILSCCLRSVQHSFISFIFLNFRLHNQNAARIVRVAAPIESNWTVFNTLLGQPHPCLFLALHCKLQFYLCIFCHMVYRRFSASETVSFRVSI